MVLHKNTYFFKIFLRLTSDILNMYHIDPTLDLDNSSSVSMWTKTGMVVRCHAMASLLGGS